MNPALLHIAEAVILHIPHASTVLPQSVEFLLGDEDLAHEVNAMTDHNTHQLFELFKAQRVVFPVSRLVVDPERFIEDPMESVGMGVVYTKTSSGESLRNISSVQRQRLIDQYYHPHHHQLTTATRLALSTYGRCLIVDCHSFPAQPLPYEVDQSRPDICIGTDLFHTPPELTAHIVTKFEGLGYTVAVNSPFAGTLVPMDYYQKDSRVQSVMVELNRKLYDTPLKLNNLKEHVKLVLKGLVRVQH
jgi:N-formylglutamate deformylase